MNVMATLVGPSRGLFGRRRRTQGVKRARVFEHEKDGRLKASLYPWAPEVQQFGEDEQTALEALCFLSAAAEAEPPSHWSPNHHQPQPVPARGRHPRARGGKRPTPPLPTAPHTSPPPTSSHGSSDYESDGDGWAAARKTIGRQRGRAHARCGAGGRRAGGTKGTAAPRSAAAHGYSQAYNADSAQRGAKRVRSGDVVGVLEAGEEAASAGVWWGAGVDGVSVEWQRQRLDASSRHQQQLQSKRQQLSPGKGAAIGVVSSTMPKGLPPKPPGPLPSSGTMTNALQARFSSAPTTHHVAASGAASSAMPSPPRLPLQAPLQPPRALPGALPPSLMSPEAGSYPGLPSSNANGLSPAPMPWAGLAASGAIPPELLAVLPHHHLPPHLLAALPPTHLLSPGVALAAAQAAAAAAAAGVRAPFLPQAHATAGDTAPPGAAGAATVKPEPVGQPRRPQGGYLHVHIAHFIKACQDKEEQDQQQGQQQARQQQAQRHSGFVRVASDPRAGPAGHGPAGPPASSAATAAAAPASSAAASDPMGGHSQGIWARALASAMGAAADAAGGLQHAPAGASQGASAHSQTPGLLPPGSAAAAAGAASAHLQQGQLQLPLLGAGASHPPPPGYLPPFCSLGPPFTSGPFSSPLAAAFGGAPLPMGLLPSLASTSPLSQALQQHASQPPSPQSPPSSTSQQPALTHTSLAAVQQDLEAYARACGAASPSSAALGATAAAAASAAPNGAALPLFAASGLLRGAAAGRMEAHVAAAGAQAGGARSIVSRDLMLPPSAAGGGTAGAAAAPSAAAAAAAAAASASQQRHYVPPSMHPPQGGLAPFPLPPMPGLMPPLPHQFGAHFGGLGLGFDRGLKAGLMGGAVGLMPRTLMDPLLAGPSPRGH